MGEVWSATHVVTGRRLAIKRLLCPSSGSAFDAARARFLLEARSACAVDHPNVVQVFDVVEQTREAPFIVMELLEGETLATRLRREHVLPWATLANLLLPVVSAVGTAHARGIVHRDLKPSNIFLVHAATPTPEVKVLDFGIAKWMGASCGLDGPKTETGSTLGTPSYMAPEQATGDRNIDHRADIWSLGVIAYECLSGARPIEGENPTQMMLRLLSSGIMPIERLVPQLPEGWASLVGRMLSRDAGRRPSDLREVYDVLAASSARRCPTFGAPGSEEPLTPVPVFGTARTAPASLSHRVRVTAFLLGSISLIGAAALVSGQLEERTPSEASSDKPTIAAATPIRDEAPRAEGADLASEPGKEPTVAPSLPVTPAPPLERPTPAASVAGGAAREKRPKSPRSTAPLRPPDDLPPGAACERSEECRSGYCVALSCR